jgi:hypothetical protein
MLGVDRIRIAEDHKPYLAHHLEPFQKVDG